MQTVQAQRGWWLKQLHLWHWVSSALCLVAMLLFAITGITLNHAGRIEARPRVELRLAQLPAPLLVELQARVEDADTAPLPPDANAWLRAELDLRVEAIEAEWSPEEIYLSLPRPGGDAWLSLDLESGEVKHERTDRGWIAWLNDLHKGRHTGPVWSWFIDLFAVACVVFCLTGLVLLQMHARQRPGTWPVVGLGFVLPLLISLLFIH
ncbi:PepSY-associated TM helix domain-containing protein [uncultured Aquimonas sp.]|uniref:PepSY-associated TM helix domain-containing protein n=1 Tax=uncultured Aquimonas sp. TaxID=385483 RepID=UPI0008697B96|nr:PepSY-associated TM helix domain-containing protein [uncultured Aquimonas sp.]ODU47911.1 MAG: hypothetical protein ABS96_03140 [Xanthomonadaceae bacterium SCN 69-123]